MIHDLASPKVVGITPFETPDPYIVRALKRSSAIAVLDIGRDEAALERALRRLGELEVEGFGIRIPEGVAADPSKFGPEVDLVVLPFGSDLGKWKGREIWVQITAVDEAKRAIADGASGIIVKGAESGGYVAEKTSFVLLQKVVREAKARIWVQGGIGFHTAAACIAAGACGVVLDSQLSLALESQLPENIKKVIRKLDGTETRVFGNYRLFFRNDLPIGKTTDISRSQILERLGAADLETNYIPMGQDVAFARIFADKFISVSGIVRAIDGSIGEHVRHALENGPCDGMSRMARLHGTAYPIAQGPMSRVSDNPEFAKSVAM
ncbi:MAG: nitronate monooxygenase, partial [Oligoflexales bacterium]|nr:nitronate monooxygenase [Oligoflexales bacterium]